MNTGIYEEKRKFNVIDFFIILLLVILVLVVVFHSQLISLFMDTGTRADVQIEFVCESIPNDIVDSINTSNNITWVEPNVHVGTLTLSGQPTKANVLYYNEANKLCIRESDTDSTFSGVIRGSAISDNGCYINGTDFLAAGMTVTLTNGQVQFTALITKVSFS